MKDPGIAWRIGTFAVHVRSSIAGLGDDLFRLYDAYTEIDDPEFCDFHIEVRRPARLRSLFRRQAEFSFDGAVPFHPLPAAHALAVFESGLNWAIAEHANQYLVVHAAAVERNGRVAIMPGVPGAGKSTLAAALVASGWRLLSDELALLSLDGTQVWPLARPISLKNESIELIRNLVPGAVIGTQMRDTMKGTVAFLKAPGDSVRRAGEPARPGWIVFPLFARGVPAELQPEPKTAAFIEIADHSYNYSLHGRQGFRALTRVVDSSACYRFTYSRLEEAIEVFERLAAEAR